MTALATEPHSGDTVTTLQPVLTSDVGRAHLLGVDGLRPVGLEELVEHAALMHRTDRKYIAPLDTVRALVADLADTHRVLEIKGRHYTTYRTLYFDTPGFEAARSHVQKRRRRWKVRSRLYVEDGLCRIEVKTKDNRGETQKVMGMSDPARYGYLEGEEADFVAFHLAGHPEVRVDELVPAAEVCYTRATLSDLSAGTRVTIDWKLRLPPRDRRRLDGRQLRAHRDQGPVHAGRGRPCPQPPRHPPALVQQVRRGRLHHEHRHRRQRRPLSCRDVYCTTELWDSDPWTPTHGPGRLAMSSSRSSRFWRCWSASLATSTCRSPSMRIRSSTRPPLRRPPSRPSPRRKATKDPLASDPAPPLLDAGDLRTVGTVIDAQKAPSTKLIKRWWSENGTGKADEGFVSWAAAQLPAEPTTIQRQTEQVTVKQLKASRDPAGNRAAEWLNKHGCEDIWASFTAQQLALRSTTDDEPKRHRAEDGAQARFGGRFCGPGPLGQPSRQPAEAMQRGHQAGARRLLVQLPVHPVHDERRGPHISR